MVLTEKQYVPIVQAYGMNLLQTQAWVRAARKLFFVELQLTKISGER